MMRKHVVIVGGGVAGLACACKLAKRGQVRITLIDRNQDHEFRPLLFQFATGHAAREHVACSLRGYLQKYACISVNIAEVIAVDPRTRTVAYRDGVTCQGDFLVLAAGAQADFGGVPGAEQNSFPLYSLDQAGRLRARILALLGTAGRKSAAEAGTWSFLIAGGGLTGTEMAGTLAELVREEAASRAGNPTFDTVPIHLVERARLLHGSAPEAREYATRLLKERGIQLRVGVAVDRVGCGHVVLSDRTTIPAGVVVWAAGLQAAPLAQYAGLPRGPGGRITVLPDLTVEGFPGLYAIGDLANIPDSRGEPLPQRGTVAQQCGRWAAVNILADVAGQPRSPFHYLDKGTVATIGRDLVVMEAGGSRARLRGQSAPMAAWLAAQLELMSGPRGQLKAFMEWAWTYFDLAHAVGTGAHSILGDRMPAGPSRRHAA